MRVVEAPRSVLNQANQMRNEGQKAERSKGYKHFKMVGFMGQDQTHVPRWAVNEEALLKVLNFQSKRKDQAQLVFGQIKPKTVQ